MTGPELGEQKLGADPEDVCNRCGGPNVAWAAPSPLWNAVMRGGSIDGPWQYKEIICPTCFAVLAEQAGIASGWRLYATDTTPLETVTPSGRRWNPETWLWEDAGAMDVVKKILIEDCGATPYQLSGLAIHWPGCVEYRFQGALGFGGKLWANDGRWYVTCYWEDETPERLAMITAANARLADLRAAPSSGPSALSSVGAPLGPLGDPE